MQNSDPIQREGLAPNFWEHKPLRDMSPVEWEALCDGCGLCCLNKLEDEDTAEVVLTRVACRLLDDQTCRCRQYDSRHAIVPECLVLTLETIAEIAYWLPNSCAYKLLWEGKPLYDWHPLISGTADTVAQAGISVRGITVSEEDVELADWEAYLIDPPEA